MSAVADAMLIFMSSDIGRSRGAKQVIFMKALPRDMASAVKIYQRKLPAVPVFCAMLFFPSIKSIAGSDFPHVHDVGNLGNHNLLTNSCNPNIQKVG